MSSRPRHATAADIPALRAIEVSAGGVFRTLDMDAVADDDPPTNETYEVAIARGHLWVADIDGAPAAYLLADTVDGCVHVEQVSVAAEYAGLGLGRGLLDHAASVARDFNRDALTLTAFRDVPWNAPYYERLGFRILDRSEWTPGLVRIRRAEAAAGLDAWPRVCLRRDI